MAANEVSTVLATGPNGSIAQETEERAMLRPWVLIGNINYD
jgi:hypothetical protein